MESSAWREWMRSQSGSRVLVPSDFPSFPGDGGLLRFGDLKSMVHYLRGGPLPAVELELPELLACKVVAPTQSLAAAEMRMLTIAAAGSHHLLAFTGKGARGELLAQHLQYLLSAAKQKPVPLRSMREKQTPRLFRYDGKSGAWGDLSLAHNGVVLLQEYGNRHPDSLATRILWEAMREGGVRGFRAGHAAVAPANVLVLAEAAECECGELRQSRCLCRPIQRENFRTRVASAPFDLKLLLRLEDSTNANPDNMDLIVEKVKAARRRMELRAKGNGHLNLREAMEALNWEEDAVAWLKVGERRTGMEEALARVAVTICDLRQGPCVTKADLFEAWHHVAGVEFTPASGVKRLNASLPSVNCTAIP